MPPKGHQLSGVEHKDITNQFLAVRANTLPGMAMIVRSKEFRGRSLHVKIGPYGG